MTGAFSPAPTDGSRRGKPRGIIMSAATWWETSIPVDMICGVSSGSVIAALYAMGHDWREIARLTKREASRRRMPDFNLPVVALTTGRRFRSAMESLFGQTAIEDLRISYFCNSCDLSTSEIVIHRTGSLASAVRASNAIPGVLPPVLSGGHMLIDGGVLNNQPGDVMKDLCGGRVIVSNVSPRKDATVDAALTEIPSAWRVLRSRINPFEPTIRVPGIPATILRTLTVASERKSREVERIADFYLRPPIGGFRVDDFSRIDEIAEAGYQYAREEIRAWKESGRLQAPQARVRP
jgi:predicted acylesterase/phospholipase RssA